MRKYRILNTHFKIRQIALNQFFCWTDKGKWFQSFNSVIGLISNYGTVYLSPDWDISRTTLKYLKVFLGENKKEIKKKIKCKIYEIVDFA